MHIELAGLKYINQMGKPSSRAETQRQAARQINSQDGSGCSCRRQVAYSLPIRRAPCFAFFPLNLQSNV